MKTKTLQHRFVENIPDTIEEGILYISLPYCIAIHKCVCGCGNEVATPLSPAGWELTFDGETVSLYPSIGNWSYACQSHYFITKNKIRHVFKWTDKQIKLGRKRDNQEIIQFVKRKSKKNKPDVNWRIYFNSHNELNTLKSTSQDTADTDNRNAAGYIMTSRFICACTFQMKAGNQTAGKRVQGFHPCIILSMLPGVRAILSTHLVFA